MKAARFIPSPELEQIIEKACPGFRRLNENLFSPPPPPPVDWRAEFVRFLDECRARPALWKVLQREFPGLLMLK